MAVRGGRLWINRLVCVQRLGGHRGRPRRVTPQAITPAPTLGRLGVVAVFHHKSWAGSV